MCEVKPLSDKGGCSETISAVPFADEPFGDAPRRYYASSARSMLAGGGNRIFALLILRFNATVEVDRLRIASLEAQNRTLQEELARLSTRLREEQVCAE